MESDGGGSGDAVLGGGIGVNSPDPIGGRGGEDGSWWGEVGVVALGFDLGGE